MKKTEFLTALGERLSGLEPNDLAERLAFYDEIIEDYKADGISEEDAVARIALSQIVFADEDGMADFTLDEKALSKEGYVVTDLR